MATSCKIFCYSPWGSYTLIRKWGKNSLAFAAVIWNRGVASFFHPLNHDSIGRSYYKASCALFPTIKLSVKHFLDCCVIIKKIVISIWAVVTFDAFISSEYFIVCWVSSGLVHESNYLNVAGQRSSSWWLNKTIFGHFNIISPSAFRGFLQFWLPVVVTWTQRWTG